MSMELVESDETFMEIQVKNIFFSCVSFKILGKHLAEV